MSPSVATIAGAAWRWRCWRIVVSALAALVGAVLLASCGADADEIAYDAEGRVVCAETNDPPEPLPQIYVLDLEDPALLAELHGIDDPASLSVVRRDVVDRTTVHIGWHRGGVVAPVRMWSTLGGLDLQRTMPPVAIDGQRTTDDPCEARRFDSRAGFYDYIALVGTGDDAPRFDVVGASDALLTSFLAPPTELTFDTAAVDTLLADFADERSTFTNRRYAVALGLLVAAVVFLWILRTAGGTVRARTESRRARPVKQ